MWLTKGMLWVGRSTATVLGLAVMLALVVGLTSTALAANGQPFLLGKLTNVATGVTQLTGNLAGPSLHVVNNNAAANATALSQATRADRPPLRVNSPTKVAKLTADKMDGESLTCPTGKLLHEGVCIGTTKPTAAELQTFRS